MNDRTPTNDDGPVAAALHHHSPISHHPPRWTVAIHESAHIITAVVYGGEALAVEARDGAGLAWSDGRLLPRDRAIVAIAGPRAEQLFADVPPPPTIVPDPLPPLPPASPGRAAPTTAIAADGVESQHDHTTIAAYCTAALDSCPDFWAHRYAVIYRLAGETLERHRAAVLELAAAIYHRGIVLRSGINPILRRHGLLKDDDDAQV